MLRKFLEIPIAFLFAFSPASAQLSARDSDYLASSQQNAVQIFQAGMKGNTHLVNGWENTNYDHRATGHPYFIADSMQSGDVLYDGTLYKDVPLLYDENNDNLITLRNFTPGHYSIDYAEQKKLRMDLVKEKTNWFTIAGHKFTRIDSSITDLNMPTGFYELAYNGTSKLYIKRYKRYAETEKQKDLERWYDIFDEYYVFNNGRFYHIKSKKNLQDAFPGKSAQVIRDLNLSFRKNREKIIYETTKYYDKLNNGL